jgi:hypothetical protein
MFTHAVIAYLESFKHNPMLKVRVWEQIYHIVQTTPKGKLYHFNHEQNYILYLLKKGGF